MMRCSDKLHVTRALLHTFVKKVLDPATRRDGNGKASKVQASIVQYVVREQHAGTLEGMHMNEKVSVKGKSNQQENLLLTVAQQIIYNQQRLGLQT